VCPGHIGWGWPVKSNGRPKKVDLPPDRHKVQRLFDGVPPHSQEDEICVLGSLLLAGVEDLAMVGDVIAILQPSDFYLPNHTAIYEGMVAVYDAQSAIDPVLLGAWLRDRDLYKTIGGQDYLAELMESVPTCVNGRQYAQRVRDKAILRTLVNAAGKVVEAAHGGVKPAEIADLAERTIFEATQGSQHASEPVTSAQIMRDTLARMQDSGHSLTGIATGIYQLDEMLCGLQRGEMVVLAARPSLGKSALMMTIAQHLSIVERVPIAIFSLEMSREMIGDRLLASIGRVDAQRIRRNVLDADELHRTMQAHKEISEAPMWVDDSPGITIMQLRSKARRLALKHKIGAIFVDYIQLMHAPGAENRQVEVATISRGIKALARELRIPIVALSQLNRKVEDRRDNRPTLSDIRESGAVEQDADVVMMLHREDYYRELNDPNYSPTNEAELIVAKQRQGPTGIVKLQWSRSTMTFRNLHPGDLYAH
jgi:replicative DNA helicase